MNRTNNEQMSAADRLQTKIAETGDRLLDGLSGVISSLPRAVRGPQSLSTQLGVDKVLASRLLKAMRATDPIVVVQRIPGPEPLRRVVKASSKLGVNAEQVSRASDAIDSFERLIREDLGDRSSLDAVISAWIPEARREFEVRRKQAAFKAMSQLKGSAVRCQQATVLLHPSADGEKIDLVWIVGVLGAHRIRPNASVHFTTRRMTNGDSVRNPMTLDGDSIVDIHAALLHEYCTPKDIKLDVYSIEEVVHYTLGGDEFGPDAEVDMVFAEANLNELNRYVPAKSADHRFMYADVTSPARLLQFDVLLHEDVFPGAAPALRVYDTSFQGSANFNDPTRDIDILDLIESVQDLGLGIKHARSADIAKYTEMLDLACTKMGWDSEKFRAYRCRIDYPLYGSQVCMAFKPPQLDS